MKKLKTLALLLSMMFCVSLNAFSEVKFPSPSGHINDYAKILSVQEKQQLESLASDLKAKTGAELAVAVVKTVEPLDPKLYAVKLFEHWKIGQKGKDNGVLILLAMQEKRIEIEVGYGLEGALPDAKAGRILDEYALPYFKQGKFGEGLIQTARAVSQVIGGESAADIPKPVKPQEAKGPNSGVIIFIIVAIIILAAIFRKPGSILFAIMGGVWGYSEGAIIGALFGALAGFFLGFWGFQFMGRGGFGGGGGFGGFGGGRSGGGGAGRSW